MPWGAVSVRKSLKCRAGWEWWLWHVLPVMCAARRLGNKNGSWTLELMSCSRQTRSNVRLLSLSHAQPLPPLLLPISDRLFPSRLRLPCLPHLPRLQVPLPHRHCCTPASACCSLPLGSTNNRRSCWLGQPRTGCPPAFCPVCWMQLVAVAAVREQWLGLIGTSSWWGWCRLHWGSSRCYPK